MTLTLLHTSASHCARFDALRNRMAGNLKVSHVIREEWLAHAQGGVCDALVDEVTTWVRAQKTLVLCTCSTLGPIAEAAGALRIDRPLMQQAAREGPPCLLAYCLESTCGPSAALLREELGQEGDIQPISLIRHWHLYETGNAPAFEAAIASDIRTISPGSGCIVLAQASMAGAAEHLADLPVPVLSSPELAFQAALDRIGLQIG